MILPSKNWLNYNGWEAIYKAEKDICYVKLTMISLCAFDLHFFRIKWENLNESLICKSICCSDWPHPNKQSRSRFIAEYSYQRWALIAENSINGLKQTYSKLSEMLSRSHGYKWLRCQEAQNDCRETLNQKDQFLKSLYSIRKCFIITGKDKEKINVGAL